METNSYFVLCQSLSENHYLVVNNYKDEILYTNPENEKFLIAGNVYLDDGCWKVETILKNTLHKGISNYVVYNGPRLQNEESFSKEIVCYAVNHFIKKYNINKGFNSTTDNSEDGNTDYNYLSCSLTGVQENQYYDLFHSEFKCMDNVVLDDISSIEIKTVDEFSATFTEKLTDIKTKSALFNSPLLAYSLICKNRQNEKKICFNLIHVHELMKFAESVPEAKVLTPPRKRLVTSAKHMIKKHLKCILTLAVTKSLNSIIRIKNLDDILEGEHIFQLLAELTQKCLNIAEQGNKDFSESEIMTFRTRLKMYEKRIAYIRRVHKKEIENVETKTRHEVVDVLSKSHGAVIDKQKESFTNLLEETRNFYESQIQYLKDCYENVISSLKEKCQSDEAETKDCCSKEVFQKLIHAQELNSSFCAQKNKLGEKLLVCQQRLSDVKSIIIPESRNTAGSQIDSLTDDLNVILIDDDESELLQKYSALKEKYNNVKKELVYYKNKDSIKTDIPDPAELTDLQDTLKKKDQLLTEAYEQIHVLRLNMKEKESLIGRLEQLLTFSEHKIEEIKQESAVRESELTEQNLKLIQDLENMKARHNEQFQKYEKLIKKSREEINIHKREANVIRQHFLGHNSPLAKPAICTEQSSSSATKRTLFPTNEKPCTPKSNSTETPDRRLRSGKKFGE